IIAETSLSSAASVAAHRAGGRLTPRNDILWGPQRVAPLRPTACSGAELDAGRRYDPLVSCYRRSTFQGPSCDRTEPGSGLGGAQGGRAAWTHAVHRSSGRHHGPRRRAEGSQRYPSERRRAVSFFTDLRSAKIEEMRHEPRVSLLGYDADAGFQVRLEGKATIDTEGPETAAAWEGIVTLAKNSGFWRGPARHPGNSNPLIFLSAADERVAPLTSNNRQRDNALEGVSVAL